MPLLITANQIDPNAKSQGSQRYACPVFIYWPILTQSHSRLSLFMHIILSLVRLF